MAKVLRGIAFLFGTIVIGFGFNGFYNPDSALSFFEVEYPRNDASQKVLVDTLLAAYAVRDIFMGVAIYAAVYFGSKKTLGVITMAMGAVAAADGVICKMIVGRGEWNHWGYAPMAAIVGLALMVV